VRLLRDAGHDVRVLSRRAGRGTHVGDLETGEGVAAATAGAELIVHAATDIPGNGKSDLAQTRLLLQHARDARHLLYPSIVGIDQIPNPYYKRKLPCEQAIADSGVPATILRATQFHELLAELLRRTERLPLAPLPTDLRFQPVAPADVAARLVEIAEGAPLGRAPDFGGPEVLTLGEIADVWRAARGRPRRIVSLPLPGRIARGFREGRNTCPDHADGRQRWSEFVT
jgi:uncharacterized protein YbjT (DUF2867 family)